MYNKILVTGASGFVGSNLCNHFSELGYNVCTPNYINNKKQNIITCSSSICNLTDFKTTEYLIDHVRPDCVIHLAATCGGIGANKDSPGRFMNNNLTIGLNIINAALDLDCVKQFINTGTICSYPKYCPIPFKETDLWNGYPEETNAPYGIAKKTLTELLIAYHKQYGFESVNLYPTNMYGKQDNFDPESSHVIPSIILKVYNAMIKGEHRIDLWGTGSPTRDFLYVEDFCRAIVLALQNTPGPSPLNIGTNIEIPIKEIAETICDIMGFNGELRWNPNLPDGQPRRCVDSSKAKAAIGYKSTTNIKNGLSLTVGWFLNTR